MPKFGVTMNSALPASAQYVPVLSQQCTVPIGA
jgi:hypothetical protein